MDQRPAYFISDVHLPFAPQGEDLLRAKELTALLDQVYQEQAALFILGDLFDFYFEYRYVVTKGYFAIYDKLYQLTQSKLPVHYVVGNHDFWVGEFLEQQLGVTVHRERVKLDFSGKTFLLDHGDGLYPKDWSYRLLKRFIRHPWIVTTFRWIHPDFGHAVARLVSHQSRQWNSEEDAELKDRIRENIKLAREYFQNGVDFFITAHVHLPWREEVGNGVFLTIGDFINHFTYGYFDGLNLQLKQWPLKYLSHRDLP